ncbi:MAG: hypothetical protein HY721_34660 [Planctomycetes bacterium]|nr:hypothetical protein [Planctomycetota bacterium]
MADIREVAPFGEHSGILSPSSQSPALPAVPGRLQSELTIAGIAARPGIAGEPRRVAIDPGEFLFLRADLDPSSPTWSSCSNSFSAAPQARAASTPPT